MSLKYEPASKPQHLVPGESHIIDQEAFLCCSPTVQI